VPAPRLVSVVVPAFGAEARIAKTIESVAAQSHRPLEIILVDDGSTDATTAQATAALSKFGIPGRVLVFECNQGPSAARNHGWHAAKGDWIQFLDDDDELHPKKIEWQVAALNGLDDAVALVHSMWASRDSRGERRAKTHSRRPRLHGTRRCDRLISLLSGDNFIPFGSALTSRRWLESAGGFDKRVRLIEDVDLQIRMIGLGASFAEVPADVPIFCYNRRRGSLSESRTAEFVEGVLRNARLARNMCIQDGYDTTSLTEVMREAFAQAIVFYASHDRTRFDDVFNEAQLYFACSHRKGSAAFNLLVGVFGWRRAELLCAGVRRAKNGCRSVAASDGSDVSLQSRC